MLILILLLRSLTFQASAPWPLELHGRGIDAPGGASVAHAAGRAVLYEGSRLWHGRPHPLRADGYAAVFVGFVPAGYPARAGWVTRAIFHGVTAVKKAIFVVWRFWRKNFS